MNTLGLSFVNFGFGIITLLIIEQRLISKKFLLKI